MAGGLRLQKNRVAVEISTGDETLTGEMFLAEYAFDHAGAERVSDLLCGVDDFFPVVDAEKRLQIVMRNAVRWVRVPRTGVAAEEEPPSDATELRVRLRLDRGAELTGAFRFLAPPERSRLQDYLNDAGRFLPLYVDDTVVLVARAHLARVVAD